MAENEKDRAYARGQQMAEKDRGQGALDSAILGSWYEWGYPSSSEGEIREAYKDGYQNGKNNPPDKK